MNVATAESTATWFEAIVTGRQPVERADVARRFGPDVLAAIGIDGLVTSLTGLATRVGQVRMVKLCPEAFRLEITMAGRAWDIQCRLDEHDRIASLREGRPASRDLHVQVLAREEVGRVERVHMHRLFDDCYRDADHAYLDGSLAALGRVALGYRSGTLVAFAVAGQRIADLPAVGPCRVLLAGLCCVHPEHRRQGIAGRVENASVGRLEGGQAVGRTLSAGRMAHAASYRQMGYRPDAVPRPGHAPSLAQRRVGTAVAGLYGVERFDEDTFVCRGPGRPVGVPVIEVEASEREVELFAPVDRARGDTLLTLTWVGQPPDAW